MICSRNYLLALTVAPFMVSAGWAADFPTRPVTIIVPAAAGGGGDTTTRILARSIEQEMGWTVSIINQGQGGGVVGLTSMVNAEPDGYTVGLLFPYAGYKYTGQADFAGADFSPIANFNGDSSSLVTSASSPFETLAGALDAIKAEPSKYKIHCSGGCGSVWDVPVAGMMMDYGIEVEKITWIPGQGAATGLQELASGGVDFQTVSLPEASGLISAGLVRPLGVLSPEPVPGFEDVPLAGEVMGHPVDGGTWRALGGPAGVSDDIIKAWEDAAQKAVQSDSFKNAMKTANFGVKWMPTEDLAVLMKSHEEDTARVMAALGYSK
ncbi:Tripartite-type tricarboxylate transporter, receptor component TctC [Cohaesibacter marisflavi]|uniref:Tripartite-type tricarboxylate transporter, receptor component TctC n=1 Tax=Cohaesibacter marisflavi TaxID=655353 RepID=A0A1I4ZWU8_9HYPH|nr:tripartite tricarboxylate transporter substrate binding protein [Cohaesibacter marisflavi]SFN54687.1 Tripartite-type tricarboxylate transporter, receptor component TctC [Cohaesibacter marisflavi]